MRTPRTAPTGTTNVSTNWGTSSGFDGQEDFEGPQDISDVVGFETEIPRGSRPTPNLPSAPSGRSGGGIDLSKPGPTPFEGMEPKRAPGRAPIGLEIGKSAGGGLGIGVSIPLGGPISARGGVNIGRDGAIKGGQVGLGIGAGPIGATIDVGTDQDEQGRGGCYQYVTVSFLGLFSHTYGRNVCESPTPTPTPTPSPSLPPNIPTPPVPFNPKGLEVEINCNTGKYLVAAHSIDPYSTYILRLLEEVINLDRKEWVRLANHYDGTGKENWFARDEASAASFFHGYGNKSLPNYTPGEGKRGEEHRDYYVVIHDGESFYGIGYWCWQPNGATSLNPRGTPSYPVATVRKTWKYREYRYAYEVRNHIYAGHRPGCDYDIQLELWDLKPPPNCPSGTPTPTPTPSPSPSPNFSLPPNPPIRKKMNNECCRILALYHQEQLRLMGRPLGPQGQLIPIPEGTFFETETERIKTPINSIADPERETIKFNNFYELLMYGLKQQIDLDVAVDPQSFVPPTGRLQNPSYERDSEQSLENNTQPDTDKKGNKRELEIGEDIQINSIAQQQQYLFAVAKRLEYLFPSGELGDARFKKSLIIPGAEGELKIHNLIHFKEFLIQFLNATLGNPKIPIKIEDTNAIKEGNQEAIFNHFSMSHMIRELYKIVLESGDDINAIMETTVRDFRTNLANRIQIVQIAEMCQALIQDTGMLEAQEFIPLKLDGDPYAGKWKPGMGFEPDADLDSNEEKATEKLMKATLKNFQAQVKVIRRDGRENADIRDLLLQLAEMFTRSTSIPATKEGIEKALAAAKFKVKVDNALSRTQVKRAAAAKLSRTKKRNK